jgi:hypothetical protein
MGVKREQEKQRRQLNKMIKHAPYNFKKGKLETIGPLLTNAQIGKNEKPSVSVVILRVLEVIQRRHNRSGCATRLSVLDKARREGRTRSFRM